jgi:hypothetical protein
MPSISFDLAALGILNAKRFKIFNEQNQLVLYAAEGKNDIQ